MSATEIPGYKIIRTLGVGGQATVYLAIQQGFDREVALKVMSPALAADPTFGERFIREAKIVAKLSHKSIVTVYDVGESGNFYYLAMEYLPNGDLKSRIESGIKTKECITIIGKLAKALHFAHEKGYIHRDVKSENILFNEDDEPVLTDFGIAKASNSSTQMTQAGKLIGTPEYMSPEQCRGKPVDGRSDLYSLGVILFEMLTRKVPYTGEDSVAVCIKHVTKPLPKLPQRLSHFQWLLNVLMAKDPAKRFQTGNDLAGALIRFGTTGKAQVVKSALDSKQATEVVEVQEDDEFGHIPDQDDHFEDLRTEKRDAYVQTEKPSFYGKFAFAVVLIIAGAVGYLTQERWYPQASQFIDSAFNQQTSVDQVIDQTSEKQSPSELSAKSSESSLADKKKTQDEYKAPSVDELLQQADALLQFKPQKIEDIKKALKLIATVNTLEPNNGNAALIYQNILNSSLIEAQQSAESKNFEQAQNWLDLVKFEQPDHGLLEVTSAKIAAMQADEEAVDTERKQKSNRVEELLALGRSALDANRLSSPKDDNAINYFQSVLEIEPDNQLALQGLEAVSLAYEKLIESAITDNSFSRAKTFLERFNSISQDQSKKLALRQKINEQEKAFARISEQRKQEQLAAEQAAKIESDRLARINDPIVQMQLLGKLDSARSLEALGNLVMPENNNALEKYRSVLEIDVKNNDALAGIKRIEERIISKLTDAIAANDQQLANQWLTQLKLFDADHPQYNSFEQAVLEIIEILPSPTDQERNDLENLVTDDKALKSPDNQSNEVDPSRLDSSINEEVRAEQANTITEPKSNAKPDDIDSGSSDKAPVLETVPAQDLSATNVETTAEELNAKTNNDSELPEQNKDQISQSDLQNQETKAKKNEDSAKQKTIPETQF